ncbi:MAG: hypothetical protein K9G46_14760 [Flavobacteriales bacterium]|nr:hypothetical protein [Flavobacteriales bacterium]
MNIARFIAAVIVAWFVIMLFGVFWGEVLFAEWYNKWMIYVEKPNVSVTYFMVVHAMRAIVFVYVYHMLYKGGKPIVKGLKFGFLMGILTGLTATGYYVDFNIQAPEWVMLEFCFNVIRAILVGVSVALIIGEREPKPAL